MRRISVIGSALAIAMIMTVSCGSKKHEESHGHDHAKETAHNAVKGEALSFKEVGSKEIFQSYLSVKNALVKGDASAASEGAGALLAIQGFEGQDAAMKIQETSDLAAQREAFADLSASVESSLTGQVTSGAVYKQFCPMAFEGKGGYWLSDQEAIKNPYYGDKMLTCGRVDHVMGAQ
ncbi:DUF3347 domain-containing protein [Echinicola vietnamensis]|uniref:DUF3347 domain-containing protein n=1 Tax=Echinicola vietnamensis (strain DSM 17526 / LMG 23754 / KMM 6221) TaxID=926556 RepID=L0G1F7_ECHVK|nr:DUF3347 domain-containing protein [Echinicola vietnamensis]AGA78685.1 Protein of unknown function (DUF3347) [Echinicola vietnamensis DSM 17526]